LSYALSGGNDPQKAWGPYALPDEGAEPEHVAAFGAYTFDELVALPARPDDPDGTSHMRVQRFADYLWSAVRSTADELT
jgi:hypothetical protein